MGRWSREVGGVVSKNLFYFNIIIIFCSGHLDVTCPAILT